MNWKEISPTDLVPENELKTLKKQLRRSRQKLLYVLLIPATWIVAGMLASAIHEVWAWGLFAAICVAAIFGIGAYIVFRFPVTDEVIHNYAQRVLPPLLKTVGVENPQVHKRHNLQTKTFLDAGLYHDRYNGILREDCIQGKINGRTFGMYETSIQIASTIQSVAFVTPTTDVRTNQFYGWFFVLDAGRTRGFHFITMRRRANSGESDDWHQKTLAHWENDTQLQKIATGDKAFDDTFRLNTDNPAELMQYLDASAKEFLLFLAQSTSNSFAISIQRSHVFVMIGHEYADLRKIPSGDLTCEFDQQMLENLTWYVEMIKGLSRMISR